MTVLRNSLNDGETQPFRNDPIPFEPRAMTHLSRWVVAVVDSFVRHRYPLPPSPAPANDVG